MTSKSTRLDDQLCFALYAATNAVVRSYRPKLDSIGLTYPQYLVMLVLWQGGAQTVGAIARRLRLPANGVTPLLDRLDAAGFVERHRDADDRRIVHVTLTDVGRDLERSAADAQSQVVCETQMDIASLNALREELRALVERMEGAECPS